MNGANEYYELFNGTACQINRFYILPHYHARGKTFRIFILPDGEKVIENGGINAPLNKDSIEVYGVISGNPGWSESYGWIHHGKWVEDFNLIVEKIKEDKKKLQNEEKIKRNKIDVEKNKRIQDLLYNYK